MIIEYARYNVPLAETKAFLSAFDRAQAALAESDQCRAWEMARGVEDQTEWVIRIEWVSLEGHQQEFRSSPHYTAYMKPPAPIQRVPAGIPSLQSERSQRSQVAGQLVKLPASLGVRQSFAKAVNSLDVDPIDDGDVLLITD